MNSAAANLRARLTLSVMLTLALSASAVAQTEGAHSDATRPPFRMEATAVENGAELLTVFGNLRGLGGADAADGGDVPLLTVLRDSLGDQNPENDRLRYVWVYAYTAPTFWQRAASGVPFLYARVGNREHAKADGMPPPVIDLAAPDGDVWRRFMWLGLQGVAIHPLGSVATAASDSFRRNAGRYRRAHLIRALAVLSLYEAQTGAESVFTPEEVREIGGRLTLADKTFGGLLDDAYLQRAYRQQNSALLDARGHNWTLLWHRTEAEGLYFEPLLLPDGSATHALVWVAREDLEKNRGRDYDKRFLNVTNPWTDERLRRWRGYSEMKYFDADNRPLACKGEGARAVELIPLALYGLDHPKIPALLVDFRNGYNPKRREMSRLALEEVARDVLKVSRFGNLQYFLGRKVYDFVTGRRGMDVNQPSRLRAYSQLKLLLSLDASLAPGLREEIGRRIERVSLNPLENDYRAEARLALEQHAALVAYARRPDGLAAKLDRDRRSEMTQLKHGTAARTLLRLAGLLSFGAYEHRESAAADDQRTALDVKRSLAFHKRYLREVAKSPLVEVVWNVDDVRRSLRYLTEHAGRGDAQVAASAARIFAQTRDAETRRLSLICLSRLDGKVARGELSRIYEEPDLDPQLRQLAGEYLRQAGGERPVLATPRAGDHPGGEQ